MIGPKLSMARDGLPDTDPVYAAATEWLLRLHDPLVTPEDILAWQAWMREHPSHTTAFRRMEELGGLFRALPNPPSASRRQMVTDTYDGSLPIRLWKRRAPQFARSWALAACALIAALALGLIAAGSIARWNASRDTQVFATWIGENRLVRLADGSTVTLGGDSEVAVSFHPRERDIDLLRGEAFFTVARNHHRPFRVAAGRAVVVAVGTQFDVRRDSSRVMVDVVEGRVVVMPHSSIVPIALLRAFRPELTPVFVDAGERTSVNSLEVEPPSQVRDPEEATSWRSGRLVFRMQPLDEVLQEVNRYSRTPIVIEDADIERLKVTGTVVGGDVGGWVKSLHSALGIVAIQKADRIVLRQGQ
jgi:transmembrane sensor